jgi:2-dehydropantoate 2-reductase
MERIAVMGAGAVGGFYGAHLARSGRHVAFIARGAHLAAMRASGLTVEREGDSPIVLPEVVATDDPTELGPVDLVLFTPKAFDLEAAAERVKPLVGGGGVVLPLLNGLDIGDRLAGVLGRDQVLAGVCTVSAQVVAPGVIRKTGPLNRIVLGELDGGVSPRVAAIAEMIARAEIPVETSDRMIDEVWRKFFFLEPWAGVCAMTGAALGPVLADADTRAVVVACLEEARALAEAQGVSVLPTVAQGLARLEALPPGSTPSLLRMLEQGAPLEVETLQGAVIRLGRRLGVPTPVHQLVYAALKLRAAGKPAAR